LPNKTFALPGFNISNKDVDQMGDRHKQVAVRYTVSEEVERRAKVQLQREYDHKQQERIAKKRSKAEKIAKGMSK
jgi:hypothetical protein